MNDPVIVAPCVLLPVQVTVVVPSANMVPDAGVQVAFLTPSVGSVVVAVNETTAPPALVASAVIAAGT